MPKPRKSSSAALARTDVNAPPKRSTPRRPKIALRTMVPSEFVDALVGLAAALDRDAAHKRLHPFKEAEAHGSVSEAA